MYIISKICCFNSVISIKGKREYRRQKKQMFAKEHCTEAR